MMPIITSRTAKGFTLIEISIVLVIIGFVIGSVLVGRDLVNASYARAQINQIEKYQQAVNTFKLKFNALPGDIDATTAARFGFTARGAYAGEGDGNGVIEGVASNAANQNAGYLEGAGETLMFWVDLSTAGLIDGNFSSASPTTIPASFSSTNFGFYFPKAKLGDNLYLYIWSGFDSSFKPTGPNFFGLSVVSSVNGFGHAGQMNNNMVFNPNITSGIDA